MKLLFLGDVVGRWGREAVKKALPILRSNFNPDFVIINGENAAGGFGITPAIFNDFLDWGADAVTLGNHAFDQKSIIKTLDEDDRIIRPMNYPKGTPGRGYTVLNKNGQTLLLAQIMGQVFVNPVLDNPFTIIDSFLDEHPLGTAVDGILIDFHAEATSEKQAFGHLCDGRASLVVGTHTHTQTNDARFLPNGTAYITDAGMCGGEDGVLGMDKNEPIYRFINGRTQSKFEPMIKQDNKSVIVNGIFVDTETKYIQNIYERY